MSAPEVVTFYSYKGGTGRSMELANVAWILAANGKRVLVIDWDLEAPGLHRYFHPFLTDKDMVRSDGLIDFVLQYADQAILPGDKAKDWYKPYANLLYYATSLNYSFPAKGTIDFVPAGRQGVDYATRVNAFNWQHFYERLDGGLLLEAAKLSMAGYDFVLIDSRTGVSDTSGICTVQMPNTLVICFTLNKQSIEGAAAVAESADAQRRNDKGERTLRIIPVPTRIESTERVRLDAGMAAARQRFDPLLWHVPGSLDDYWSRVSVQYQPFYAFEEILAVFGDAPGRPQSMLASMEALAGWIATPGNVLSLPALSTAEREAILAQYLRQQSTESPLVIRRFSDHEAPVKTLNLAQDTGLLTSGDSAGKIFEWDLTTLAFKGRIVQSALPAVSDARIGAMAANGEGVIVCGTDSGEVYSVAPSGSPLLGRHNGPVTALALASDSSFAISGSYDRLAIRWSLSSQTAVMTYSGHADQISSIALDGTGTYFLSGSFDKTLKLWEVNGGRLLRTFEGHTDKVHAVALNADGRLAASGSADKSVRIWDVATGVTLLHLTGHSDAVNAVVFAADGNRVVSASDDGSLIVWNVEEAAATVAAAAQVRPPSTTAQPAAEVADAATEPFLYLAYLSYSREDRDSYFAKFMVDLEREVARTGMSKGRAVWYNVDDSRGFADVWSDSPLRSARVAVCLISPSYLESEYCGREVSLFLERSTDGGGIYPIVWKPVETLPSSLCNLLTDTGLEGYHTQGLAYMMRLSRYRDEYGYLLQRFATDLVRIASNSPLDHLPDLPSPDAFPNAFTGVATGVAEVSFVIRSLVSFGRTLQAIALDAAKEAGIQGANFVSIGSDIVDKAARIKTTLIAIIDAEHSDFESFASSLQGQPHCALLVLNRVAGRRPPKGIGYYEQNITSAARLRDAVINAIVKIRSENIRQTVVEPSLSPVDYGSEPEPDAFEEGSAGPHSSLPNQA